MSKRLSFVVLASLCSVAACSGVKDGEEDPSVSVDDENLRLMAGDGGGEGGPPPPPPPPSDGGYPPPPTDGGGPPPPFDSGGPPPPSDGGGPPPPFDGGPPFDSGGPPPPPSDGGPPPPFDGGGPPPDAGGPPPGGLDLRKSFAVTDQAILTNFTFQRVMNQLTQQAATPTTSLGLYQQWWDTQHTIAQAATGGPHCNDQTTGGTASFNGFPWQCPRNEGDLTSTNPFLNGGPSEAGPGNDAFVFPIGLFNRFDLAPTNGANCGEYRIIFGNTRSRNLIIFEAVMPNPTPSCGVNSCRPIAQFWADLSSPTVTVNDARTRLENFYFNGLPGFEPVVHVNHYGAVGGQVRSNQFMGGANAQLWNLKEFKLAKVCGPLGKKCQLQLIPATVKTNPGTQLFSDTTTDSRKAAFQAELVGQVPSLAVNNINGFGMSTSDQFNSGQSHSQSFDSGLNSPTITNDYRQVFNPNGPFAQAIQAKLSQIGSTLTPVEIVERATTQSCGGCHQFSNFRSLGGGLQWPPSAGFVQVSEFGSEQGGFGPGFPISSALRDVFLPHRRNVLQGFLDSTKRRVCATPLAMSEGAAAAPAPTSPSDMTLGGKRSVH